MKNQTSSLHGRKASENRADRISIKKGEPAGENGSATAESIKLGVDTHAGQYTFAGMVDYLGMEPTQSLSPQEFLRFL